MMSVEKNINYMEVILYTMKKMFLLYLIIYNDMIIIKKWN
jgi:hypothetical protein